MFKLSSHASLCGCWSTQLHASAAMGRCLPFAGWLQGAANVSACRALDRSWLLVRQGQRLKPLSYVRGWRPYRYKDE
jgi:hypothetical protein